MANPGDNGQARVADRLQMLMRRQDDTLGVISGTLHNLASQAGLIGHEVSEQSEWVCRSKVPSQSAETCRLLDDLTTM